MGKYVRAYGYCAMCMAYNRNIVNVWLPSNNQTLDSWIGNDAEMNMLHKNEKKVRIGEATKQWHL